MRRRDICAWETAGVYLRQRSRRTRCAVVEGRDAFAAREGAALTLNGRSADELEETGVALANAVHR